MHAKISTHVTLTSTSESEFRFKNQRLDFANRIELLNQLRYTEDVWHTHAFGQNISMHVEILIPVTLISTSEVCVKVLKSEFRFRILIIARITIVIHLLYLTHTHVFGQNIFIHATMLTLSTFTFT